jgi:hypothetical protein
LCSYANKKRDISILKYKIVNPSNRQSKAQQEFSTLYHGKTLGEMGVEMFPIEEYTYEEGHVWLR